MISKSKLYILAQIIETMEETSKKLEKAVKSKNAEEFERSKSTLLEFQKRLNKELGA